MKTKEEKQDLANELKNGLLQFSGTENYYKHCLGVMFTDGVHYLAEKAGAYWLLDVIASYQRDRRVRQRAPNFQIWTLDVDLEEQSGIVRCFEDLDEDRTMEENIKEREVLNQKIPYTDFPLETIKLYVIGVVILLPGEY